MSERILKAQPSQNDVHVNRPLTNMSIAYKNATYIADELFPIVPVNKQSDIVPAYPQSAWFRDEARIHASGTKSAESGYPVDTSDTYYCPRYSMAKVIPDDVRDNADEPFNLDREAVEFCTDKVQMRRERAFAADFFALSVWGTDKTGGTDFTVWSNYGGSSPLVDVASYKNTVEGKIGREPNRAAMGKDVLVQLQNHPDVIDLIKYTQRGQVTEELLASLLGFERLLIGRGIYTADSEGLAEASVTYTRIWGKHMLMLWVPSAPSLMEPAAGYTFVWQRVPNAIQYAMTFRRQEEETDVVRVSSYFDQKKTAANAGLFVSGAVA